MLNLRNNLEESMHREMDIYKTLAEQSFTGVYVIQHGVFVYITRNMANFFGSDVEILIGKKPETIAFPEDWERNPLISR